MKALGITLLVAIVLVPATPLAADPVTVGTIDFSGNFTVSHLFNIFIPTNFVGTFGPMTVTDVTGIFLPYVSVGNLLTMSTPNLFLVPLPPLAWTIGGYTIVTDDVLIAETQDCNFPPGCIVSESAGTFSGNGFDPSKFPFPVTVAWQFFAPIFDPTDHPVDITGPIQMDLAVTLQVPPVNEPEPTTALTLILAIIAIAVAYRSLARL